MNLQAVLVNGLLKSFNYGKNYFLQIYGFFYFRHNLDEGINHVLGTYLVSLDL